MVFWVQIVRSLLLYGSNPEVPSNGVNRGEGSGVAADQVWRVFAVGKELVDPDTQEFLGKEEVEIGRVRITDAMPKFSKASILEDRGIAEGAILRK